MKRIPKPSVWMKIACVFLLGVVTVGPQRAVAQDTSAQPKLGDVNRDGCVDDSDVYEIAIWLGEPVVPNHPILTKLDLDGNGRIEELDMDVCMFNYTQCE